MTYTVPFCVDTDTSKVTLHDNMYKYSQPQKPFNLDNDFIFSETITNNHTSTIFKNISTNITLDLLFMYMYFYMLTSLIFRFINIYYKMEKKFMKKNSKKKVVKKKKKRIFKDNKIDKNIDDKI
jgi:predicted membrane protein